MLGREGSSGTPHKGSSLSLVQDEKLKLDNSADGRLLLSKIQEEGRSRYCYGLKLLSDSCEIHSRYRRMRFTNGLQRTFICRAVWLEPGIEIGEKDGGRG